MCIDPTVLKGLKMEGKEPRLREEYGEGFTGRGTRGVAERGTRLKNGGRT